MTHLLALIRWCWCQACMERTDQDKTERGWKCRACGHILKHSGETLELD